MRNGYNQAAVGGLVLVAVTVGVAADPSMSMDLLITTREAEWVAADAGEEDGFGRVVAISGDTAVVGASAHDGAGVDAGRAYVFQRQANGWSQVAELLAADVAADDRFGSAVSISADMLLVGAPLHHGEGFDSGAAYVFRRNAGGADHWGQVAKLTAEDADPEDRFGISVSISGDTIVVGAFLSDDAGDRSGSAYVFERSAGGVDAWNQVAKLTATDAASFDFFGGSVAISRDTVVVGYRSGGSRRSAAIRSSTVLPTPTASLARPEWRTSSNTTRAARTVGYSRRG